MTKSRTRVLLAAAAGMMVTLGANAAFGAVTREGEWPDADKKISVDVSGASKSEAVQAIAQAAGWSIVMRRPSKLFESTTDKVDIHVKDVPAAKVLELALSDADYVAKRDGNLIDIAPGAKEEALPPPPRVMPPPVPSLATGTHSRPEDREVTGGTLRIEKGEVVDDVTVFAGTVDVLGDVEGDLVVIGGSATVHQDAHVHGDATAVGGTLNVKDGAVIDGDVGVVGGVLDREPGAKIGGTVTKRDKSRAGHSREYAGAMTTSAGRLWHDVGHALARSALLFVFGAVLLSLATQRMDMMKSEIAQKPVRVFAIGVVSAIVVPIVLAILCITIVGIPIALIATLAGAVGAYAGVCAVLSTAGKAIIAHKSDNQHVHLAVGCALFLVASAIPGLGSLVTVIVAFMGIGVFFATRMAGFAPPKNSKMPGGGPYRTAG